MACVVLYDLVLSTLIQQCSIFYSVPYNMTLFYSDVEGLTSDIHV